MQTEDAPELTPEFLEDLRRYTEYGWGPGITAALLNRRHPVALTNLDVIRLRRHCLPMYRNIINAFIHH